MSPTPPSKPKTPRADPRGRRRPEPLGQATVELSKIGSLRISWNDVGVVGVSWAIQPALENVREYRHVPPAYRVPLRDLDRGRGNPALVSVDLGGTAFQRQVWMALRAIPLGKVRTYAGIATDIHNPRATRAVGMANGANPIPIFVPCHRVIAAGSHLGGFSAGVGRKRTLLELEGVEFEGDLVLPGQLALSL